MSTTLALAAVGSVVMLNLGGTAQEFIVVHQGRPSGMYDVSCDGTWLLMKDSYGERQWHTSNSSRYKDSDIHSWLNSSYFSMLGSDIQQQVKSIKLPYTAGAGSTEVYSGADGLSAKIFLLSGYELGWTIDDRDSFPIDGACLDYFEGTALNDERRIAYKDGSAVTWWTRSPDNQYISQAWLVASIDGGCAPRVCSKSYGIRPALILPPGLVASGDGTVTLPAPTLTLPGMLLMQGQTVDISWTAVEGAVAYTLQRKADTDATWVQVYAGTELSYSETAGKWTSVQYRVRAEFSYGGGAWATSDSIPVGSASGLALSGTDGELGALTEDVVWTAINETGNEITAEVTVNGTVLYSGAVTSGAENRISVWDLPAGAGSITITAEISGEGETASAERNWTYTKATMNWPSEARLALLQDGEASVLPLTVAEAVRMPGGQTLDAALAALAAELEALKSQVEAANAAIVEGV